MTWDQMFSVGGRILRRFIPKRFIVIHGFYGAGNVGDEAILAATLEQVRAVTDLQPLVFCAKPKQVKAVFGVNSVNPAHLRQKRLALFLMRTEAYLLGGGGLLKDYGSEEDRKLERTWLQWLTFAQDLGVKTMLWSVGAENIRFPGSKAALRAALGRTDVLTVRDEDSKARLQEIGGTRDIEVTADPVPYLAHKQARVRRRPVRPRVLVNMRHWYPYDFNIPDEDVFERALDAVAGTLDHLVDTYAAEVAFLPFRTSAHDDDRAVCQVVQQRMRTAADLYEDDPTVERTLERLGGADLIIAMRLHASVMATAMGIPSVAIGYMPKVGDYMRSIGQEAMCTDMEMLSRESLIASVEDALARYEQISRDLVRVTASTTERFDRNRQLLAALLD